MSTLFYIDGYNVLHKSSVLRPLVAVDLETARDGLIDKVAAFCMVSGQRARVVFDGRGLLPPERMKARQGVGGLEIVYTPSGLTADAYIERAVYKAANRLNLVVVSNDRGLRDLCRNMGALTMEADSFIATAREARDQTSSQVARTHRGTGIETLEDRLDGNSMARLESLRRSLENPEEENQGRGGKGEDARGR